MSSSAGVDLQEIYNFALQLGKDAGKLLDEGWRSRCKGTVKLDHVEKESAVDLVTQTDEGKSNKNAFGVTMHPLLQEADLFVLLCSLPQT